MMVSPPSGRADAGVEAMRLATFNVENMFERAKALSLETWAAGRPILEDHARLSALIAEPLYAEATRSELLEIMARHKGLATNGRSTYLVLREVRGSLVRRVGGAATVVAGGRADWLGWFELAKGPVRETATANTARVIGLVGADVLCVVEAENRSALKRFSEGVLPTVGAQAFAHVMLIDGNDERGIDVGIMTKAGYEIAQMRSHVDDRDPQGQVFSRDCAEYECRTPSGRGLLLLVNHFKSKGYGRPAASAARRLRQARRVRAIYEAHLAAGRDHVAVVGDLNEVPGAAPLDPLVREGSSLTDVMTLPRFRGDGREGTRANGTRADKLDYILLSPALAARVSGGGIERRGVWGGKNGTLFPHLATIATSADAASDHAALWVDLDI